MRTTKLAVLGTLLVTFALLAFDVVDFCRVADDGTVTWQPTVRTAAIRKYGLALWHAGRDAVTPSTPVDAARAPASRR